MGVGPRLRHSVSMTHHGQSPRPYWDLNGMRKLDYSEEELEIERLREMMRVDLLGKESLLASALQAHNDWLRYSLHVATDSYPGIILYHDPPRPQSGEWRHFPFHQIRIWHTVSLRGSTGVWPIEVFVSSISSKL
jgi:hypothetical protein